LYFAVKLRRFGVAVSSAVGTLGAATTREGGIAGEISDPASAESGICEGITMGSVSFALKCKLQTVKCLTLIGTEGVAAEVAMLDHMLEGRLNFGISPGGLMSDAEAFGNLDRDRNAMFLECINMVLDIWAGEAPYNLKGEFWEVSTERTMMRDIGQGDIMKPYQAPHPPIVGTAVAPFSKGVAAMAERGWQPISANFLLPRWVATHWPKYVEGCEAGGITPDYTDWRVAKNICVADDVQTARAYARDPGSPYVLYYSQLLTKLKKGGRANLFKEDQSMSDDEVTLDYVLDRLVIHGDPSSVTDQILALREETGPFKHLVYAGHDWTDYDLGRNSMILMGEKVLPVLQDATKSEDVNAAA
jgi:alkanesulfonate monooxygenase SsuD/methylene tetrahydromethanopterin reductase-like flavin-dependent oxidoreductase (luciferase family)